MKGTNIVVVVSRGLHLQTGVEKYLRKYHGEDVRIEHVRSARVFETSQGLDTLIIANKNRGMVYVMEQDIQSDFIKDATDRKRTFGVICRTQPHTPLTIVWRNLLGRDSVSSRSNEATQVVLSYVRGTFSGIKTPEKATAEPVAC